MRSDATVSSRCSVSKEPDKFAGIKDWALSELGSPIIEDSTRAHRLHGACGCTTARDHFVVFGRGALVVRGAEEKAEPTAVLPPRGTPVSELDKNTSAQRRDNLEAFLTTTTGSRRIAHCRGPGRNGTAAGADRSARPELSRSSRPADWATLLGHHRPVAVAAHNRAERGTLLCVFIPIRRIVIEEVARICASLSLIPAVDKCALLPRSISRPRQSGHTGKPYHPSHPPGSPG